MASSGMIDDHDAKTTKVRGWEVGGKRGAEEYSEDNWGDDLRAGGQRTRTGWGHNEDGDRRRRSRERRGGG